MNKNYKTTSLNLNERILDMIAYLEKETGYPTRTGIINHAIANLYMKYSKYDRVEAKRVKEKYGK